VNGVHDMGGMQAFGPVVAEPDEPVFHARWEGVVRAVFERTNRRYFNLDEFRRAMELMPPAAYLESRYYEKWLYALEAILVEKGVVTRDELSTVRVSAPAPPVVVGAGKPPALKARFQVGDRVVTRNLNPRGHTRLPRYARAKHGRIRSVNGPFLLPDSNAHGKGPDWQPCYAVEFRPRELWGAEADRDDKVCVDLWESYLEPDEKG
jgi:nitrile hydratase beta subunit